MSMGLPMEVGNKVLSTTDKVWDILMSSRDGNLEHVKELVNECPELVYAQYNYTPPIHFAVREGHNELVSYLLEKGAHDPAYKTYPFLDSLETIAADRGFREIVLYLQDYAAIPSRQQFFGDNGKIFFNRTEDQLLFQKAVDQGDIINTQTILNDHPEFALDETYFWGEGILTFAAKLNNRAMVDLLMSYGAKVPDILKWTQKYYFERLDGAIYMMEKGMNPNTMSWHHVTILHDMAKNGDLARARLLIDYGADVNLIEEEYQSTPLGLAARWGHLNMVNYLLEQGADPELAGARWATPLSWAVKKGHTVIAERLKNG
jgi:ankyrin repeat protein